MQIKTCHYTLIRLAKIPSLTGPSVGESVDKESGSALVMHFQTGPTILESLTTPYER